jgi:hypothetical protein
MKTKQMSKTLEEHPLTPGQIRAFMFDDDGTLGQSGCNPRKWTTLTRKSLVSQTFKLMFRGRYDLRQIVEDLKAAFSGRITLTHDDLSWVQLTRQNPQLSKLDTQRLMSMLDREYQSSWRIDLHPIGGLRYHPEHLIETLDEKGELFGGIRANDEASLFKVWAYARARFAEGGLLPELIVVPHLLRGTEPSSRFIPVICNRSGKLVLDLFSAFNQEGLDWDLSTHLGVKNGVGSTDMWVASAVSID